jgi:hypothetical protein
MFVGIPVESARLKEGAPVELRPLLEPTARSRSLESNEVLEFRGERALRARRIA